MITRPCRGYSASEGLGDRGARGFTLRPGSLQNVTRKTLGHDPCSSFFPSPPLPRRFMPDAL